MILEVRKGIPEYYNPNEFLNLEKEKQEILLEWIKNNFDHSKGFNRTYGVYNFKHWFENHEKGFYTRQGEFTGALIVAGFEYRKNKVVRDEYDFKISSKSLAIKKNRKLKCELPPENYF